MKNAAALVAMMVAGVLSLAGFLLLRDATLSTHQSVHPDSSIELVMRVRTHGGEPGQSVAEMAEAQLLMCRLEVKSDPVDALEPLGDGRFRAILTPAMDRTDRRQLRGCLEDWTVDHVRTDVERLANLR